MRCPRQSLCRLALTLARLARSPPPPVTTGQHVVSDISCVSCAVIVGWVYVRCLSQLLRSQAGPRAPL